MVPVGEPRFRYRWDNWNRPDVPYYFAVRAMDHGGNMSPLSNVVSVVRPSKIGQGEVRNRLEPYKRSRLAFASNPPTPPANLHASLDANGEITLSWSHAEIGNLAGYMVYRSDYPPEAHKGYFLQLSGSATKAREFIKAGDMVVVSKKFYSPSRMRYHTNRVWGAYGEFRTFMPGLGGFPDEDSGVSWELSRHEPDSTVTEAGETFMRLKLDKNKRFEMGLYNHSGTGQDWYDVLETKPYKVEVWLRHEGQGSVRFKLNGHYDSPPNKIQGVEWRPGPQWKKYSFTFTPPSVQEGARPNQMVLEFSGPGVFDIDNYRVYRADTEYMDFSEVEYKELKTSGMAALRTHAFIKSGRRTYDMEQFTNPAGVISGSEKLNTLPQTLEVMRKAKVRPWLQIEPHMAPSEWRAFVEYVAGSYDPGRDSPKTKPWAYKRYKQGQRRPWVDEFDRIYFELGNETWNSLFAPWVFTSMTDSATGKQYSSGQVYGLFQEYVAAQLRSSPYWKEAGLDDKFVFVLGGWNGFAYGAEAASPHPLLH